MNEDQHDHELIPISLVAHHAFCPRRAWLEAMGERTDTHQMAVGTAVHGASDNLAASRASTLRAVEVTSQTLGIVGRCDRLTISDSGAVTVVEHKATPVRRRPEVTEPMVVQVALQVFALRESGMDVHGGAVYFTEHEVTVPVPVGDREHRLALAHVDGVRAVLAAADAPPPLEDDPRCTRCSHADVCLPDERRLAPVRRRILVADPDSQVVHLVTPGSRAATRGGRLKVTQGDRELSSVPLERVEAIVVHGNVDLSSGLVRELLWRDLPIVWCSGSGRVIGWAASATRPNGWPRVRQHVESEKGLLSLARAFVTAKICNQATLLRRRGSASPVSDELRALQRRAAAAASLPELFGIEGDAAARYFAVFSSMLTQKVQDSGLCFTHRDRRPAADPVNAALNYAYGLLTADLIRAVIACGLDPHAGFLHSSKRNKPALALDLAEEFRAPIADSVVLGAFNNGELKASDFTMVSGAARLRQPARRALVEAYERRVNSTFQHPTFGYQVTWRRAMEIQARLVLGVLDGTQPGYRGVMTR
ncbi:CRISPR-associated endonuclease Cas1 [Lapillicoccus sp.]|uniref:CRISPR-associated endonuclease Cas1 n=1 Tax=Lapillicoccus sp. TaxID=1909287 RepID=UPI0025F6888D|nr:CRISPR-associated endonuclease Cas1 [Lapillicoccus sp.]